MFNKEAQIAFLAESVVLSNNPGPQMQHLLIRKRCFTVPNKLENKHYHPFLGSSFIQQH